MRIFLSYHTPDRELAKDLKEALEQSIAGAEVFFDQESQRFGGLWQEVQSQRIAECDAFVILVGSKVGDWQRLEYYEARFRRATDDTLLLLPVVIVDRAVATVANLPGLTQFHWIEATEPTAPVPLAKIISALKSKEVAAPVEPWRLIDPFRGLQALDEQDADFFFGREAETALVLDRIVNTRGRVLTLIGNSGVGKSSLVKAGIIGALKAGRLAQGGALPEALADSRRWAYVTVNPGTDPLGGLVHQFLRLWQLDPTEPDTARKRHDWVSGLRSADEKGRLTLSDLIKATDARMLAPDAGGAVVPHYLLYIDQGEELFSRASADDRACLAGLLAAALADMPERLTVMMTLRSDYYGQLQADQGLFAITDKIDVLPLTAVQLRRALGEPVRALGARFDNTSLLDEIIRNTAMQADGLPLLADLFQDLWKLMRERGDGVMRLSDHPEIIQVGSALKQRADRFLHDHPAKVDAVRRLFTLRLAEIPRVGEPVRAEMPRDDTTPEGCAEWALAEELAGEKLRLVTTGFRDGKPKAWVAHEVLLRSWSTLAGWLEAERDFLVWKGEADARRRLHEAATDADKPGTLLMGFDLYTAREWRRLRADDIGPRLSAFIADSMEAADRSQRRRQRLQVTAIGLMLVVIIGLLGILNESSLRVAWFQIRHVHPVTSAEALALGPGKSFLDCGDVTGEAGTSRAGYSGQCPEMVVVPAGSFVMGSPVTELHRDSYEGPQHEVKIGKPFAVSKFEITREQWMWCAWSGPCKNITGDGIATYPVTYVSLADAQAYVAWLSQITGHAYRLLSEAEWEYVTRAGTSSAAYWPTGASTCDYANVPDLSIRRRGFTSNDKLYDGKVLADCDDGAEEETHVGTFKPNMFNLHDTMGNVWEMVEDCFLSYDLTPRDGSAAVQDQCEFFSIRGGGYWDPAAPRPAMRGRYRAGGPGDAETGFRVARVLK